MVAKTREEREKWEQIKEIRTECGWCLFQSAQRSHMTKLSKKKKKKTMPFYFVWVGEERKSPPVRINDKK